MDLLQWWSLIFLLPALAALLYLLLLASGSVAADGGDVDLDADVDVDADGDVGDVHGVEHAFSSGEQPHESGSLRVLSVLGFGRVPLSLLLISFWVLWGFIGWVGNQLFGSVIDSPAVFIWPSLALALVGAAGLTRTMAFGLARVLPTTETYAVGNRQLVGRVAEARYAITPSGGTAQLYDDYGSLHEIPCRVQAGEAPIPPNTPIVLWRYDDASGAFLVLRDQALDGATSRGARLEGGG